MVLVVAAEQAAVDPAAVPVMPIQRSMLFPAKLLALMLLEVALVAPLLMQRLERVLVVVAVLQIFADHRHIC